MEDLSGDLVVYGHYPFWTILNEPIATAVGKEHAIHQALRDDDEKVFFVFSDEFKARSFIRGIAGSEHFVPEPISTPEMMVSIGTLVKKQGCKYVAVNFSHADELHSYDDITRFIYEAGEPQPE